MYNTFYSKKYRTVFCHLHLNKNNSSPNKKSHWELIIQLFRYRNVPEYLF